MGQMRQTEEDLQHIDSEFLLRDTTNPLSCQMADNLVDMNLQGERNKRVEEVSI